MLVQTAVIERWGEPNTDPHLVGRRVRARDACRSATSWSGIQPARGYHIDPGASYHDPDLVPPHGYLAFYAWLRRSFGAHAIVHVGKHGNLEWLPGKALALSAELLARGGARPAAAPLSVHRQRSGRGHAGQAARAAVIVDHLVPPLTRAESYGPLRRSRASGRRVLRGGRARSAPHGVPARRDPGAERPARAWIATSASTPATTPDAALGKLDNYLCELKELQIRDGLHVFGERSGRRPAHRSPGGAGARAAWRGRGRRCVAAARARERSRACRLRSARRVRWRRPGAAADRRPAAGQRGHLAHRWRHGRAARAAGARRWSAHGAPLRADWTRNPRRARAIETALRPSVLSERPPTSWRRARGPSMGASSSRAERRADPRAARRAADRAQLLLGRQRAVPTPAAWHLGWKSAALVIERYVQEHGDWPRALALSVWGTANMRTGGDDIAQALALIGARPVWDGASHRVTGTEILPLGLLDRPRVDVTLRVSGFFRDAFPEQIALFDRAVRAVAALDEPAEHNPIAARVAGRRAGADRARGRARRCPPPRQLSHLRLQARRLRRRPAGADRRARLGERCRPGARLPRLGRLCLRRRSTEGVAEHRLFEQPARRGRAGPAQPGQPRARHARQRRLLPVRGRPDRGRAPSVGRAARDLPQRSLAARDAAHPAR